MVKRLLLTTMAVAGVFGGAVAAAPAASADVPLMCSRFLPINGFVAMRACIGLIGGIGKAETQLQVDTITAPPLTFAFDYTITIQRSGNHATQTCTFAWNDTQPEFQVCDAFAGDPAGTQAWRGDSTALGTTIRSPTITG